MTSVHEEHQWQFYVVSKEHPLVELDRGKRTCRFPCKTKEYQFIKKESREDNNITAYGFKLTNN